VNSWQCRNAATWRLAVTKWASALLAKQHDGPNTRTVDIMHDCGPETLYQPNNRHDVRIPGKTICVTIGLFGDLCLFLVHYTHVRFCIRTSGECFNK